MKINSTKNLANFILLYFGLVLFLMIFQFALIAQYKLSYIINCDVKIILLISKSFCISITEISQIVENFEPIWSYISEKDQYN